MATAAAGGVVFGVTTAFNPGSHYDLISRLLTIIVLGGRGHYLGALIGGLMLAILENLVSLMIPNGTAMVELAAYGLMVFVLLIRPSGLMGVKEG